MYHRHGNRFGRTQFVYEVTLVMWNPILVHLETVLDRCMVCAKDTIGSEIILDAPDGTPS